MGVQLDQKLSELTDIVGGECIQLGELSIMAYGNITTTKRSPDEESCQSPQ